MQVSGTVTNAAQRSEIARVAENAGATGVDTHALAIAWWRTPPAPQPHLADDDLRALVSNALAADARVPLSAIDVSAHDGHVFLAGVVDDIAERRAAEADARRVRGVTDVTDDVALRHDVSLADQALAEKAHHALLRDPYVYASEIGVTSKDGVVQLHGLVLDDYERSRAEQIVEHVPGVVGVEDQLDVESSATKPYAATQLRRDVEAQLSYTPNVDATKIHVVVHGDDVTLLGSVPTAEQKRGAEEAAHRAGARVVTNDLHVGR